MAVFPFAGPRHGRAAVLAAMAGIAELYALENYRPEIVIVEDDRAAVLSDVSFTQRSTRRLLRFRVANFLRIAGRQADRIPRIHRHFDTVEQALGRELPL